MVAHRKVLVVEDNRDAAETLAAMLNLLGYDAHVAFSGTEALERAAVELPHAILLDIGMPGLNGFEVARGVKGEACGREVVLIALINP